MVDLLERFGDSFTSDVIFIYRRAACRVCGERMKVAGGYFVRWLQKNGDLHRMVMPARTDQPTF